MNPIAIIAIAVVVLGFGLYSRRLEHGVITAPMVFVLFGLLMGLEPLGFMELHEGQNAIHVFAEITLILVLFGDAARIDLRALRREYELPLRMLAIGMPLTIALGTLAGWFLFPDFPIFEVALLAAVLAPTDAALGQAVVNDESVPARVRQTLNVESGLNDGVVLPVILVLAACAEAAGQHELTPFIALTAKQLGFGPLVGVAIGFFGGRAIDRATRRGSISHEFEQLSGLALAFLAFAGAEQIGGNGFISAFVAGLTMGNTARERCGRIYDFMETEGHALILITFLLFGAVMVPPAVHEWTPSVWIYALLSLTVVRMLPVSLSLAGASLRARTHVFLGWFGPRGIASILFALLILERSGVARRHEIVAIVVATVLASVFAHGMSASAAARAYGRYIESHPDGPRLPERREVGSEMPTRAGQRARRLAAD